MTEAISPESFNLIALFLRADGVVKFIMALLALFSLMSWAVIVDRALRLGKSVSEAKKFEAEVDSGRSLEDIALHAGDAPTHPLPRMLVTALHEWKDLRGRTGESSLALERLNRQLDALITRETETFEAGLGLLSVVATSSPFIGLFGTVWGIMHAFSNIAQQGNTSLATVAPAIAEALAATALGLGAAIPAYIAYNKFTLDSGKLAGRLDAFADELIGALARRLYDRAG